MKILILLGWVALAVASPTLAQHTLTAFPPILLKTPVCTQWQMKQAVHTPDGLLLIGQCSSSGVDSQMVVAQVDALGKIAWEKLYNQSTPLSIAYSPDETAVLVSQENGLITVTKIDCKQQGGILWEKPVGQGINGSSTTQADGRVGIVTDDGATVRLLSLLPDGELDWETILQRKSSNRFSRMAITSLASGGYAVTKAGEIWAVDKAGQIRWKVAAETDQIEWEAVRQLSTGEIAVLGSGQPNVLNANRTDAHVRGIAVDGSHVVWETAIGFENSREMAYDISETNDGQLLVLCQRDDQPELVLLDNQHRVKSVHRAGNQESVCSLRYLLPTAVSGEWLAIGNAEETGIVLQSFRRTLTPETNPDRKPSLFLVSIGVKINLHYTRQDAESIARLFQAQKGGVFKEVHTELLIADSVTTGGHLAKMFELLSTKPIQPQDLLIVFYSGNGQIIDDNYLLMGNDYNAAALRTTTLSISQMLADLNNLPGRKLVLLDACYSGAAASPKLKIPRDVSLLAGSLADQVAFEDRVWQHGAFTKTVLMGLQSAEADDNLDGLVTTQELYKYAAYYLPRLVRQAKNVYQHPVLWQTNGDFPIFKTTP